MIRTQFLEGPGYCQVVDPEAMSKALVDGKARRINEDQDVKIGERAFVWNDSHKLWVRFA